MSFIPRVTQQGELILPKKQQSPRELFAVWLTFDKRHEYSDRDHAGFAYGSKGAADGFSEFAKHIADGHVADALEAGEHALSGAEGHKKYSYFTQGSGPHGFYSKGYWGTNGEFCI
ncbi:hypothetical protein WUBG_15151 [Wuchereria bancrofti]|uniref:Uncharacterized protein n=1 Tax=Wuchereria bancrofti TaxID=6293 RepID=J9AIE4_WUCBA|nr:hypothetical protein WUBG_15151 [Wuchereria bancrofti]